MTGRDYTQVEEFMEMIVKWVFRPAISDAIELIEDPPGRKPHTSLVSLRLIHRSRPQERFPLSSLRPVVL